jgi:hypothetical protein
MRRFATLALAALLTVAYAGDHAHAQYGGGQGPGGGPGGPSDQDDADSAKKKKRDEEWNQPSAPLPALRNAGPCPYVKVLYDAARYHEFTNGQETSSAVAYTGEIQGISAACEYKDDQPIKVQMKVLFTLGKGPQAPGDAKTYRYWVAVTDRNKEVIAKEYFDLPVKFGGKERVDVTDELDGIVIPRAAATTSGSNFEVLVGFDVTPEMADFNRAGKRFRPNAGAATTTQ